MSLRHHNFDILITEGIRTHEYQIFAKVETLGNMGANGSSKINIEEPTVVRYLEDIQSRRSHQDILVALGSWLFDVLFVPPVRSVFDRAIGEIALFEDVGLRIRLDIKAAGLHILPWELLYAPTEHAFLACERRFPVARYIPVPKPMFLEVGLPLRMLVAIPEAVAPYPEINVDGEKQIIAEALDGLSGRIEVTWLEGNVALDDIRRHLSDHDCVHFIGHGDFVSDHGVVVLNDPRGGLDLVDDDRFAATFAGYDQPRLVVLNACQTAARAAHDRMLGVAPQLVAHGVPAVIAMQYSIYDSAALTLTTELYRSLLQGPDQGLVDCAVTAARAALAARVEVGGEREFAAPVLFMRTLEGLLFEVEGPRRVPLRPAALRTAELIRRTRRENVAQLAPALEPDADPEFLTRYRKEHQKLVELEGCLALAKALLATAASVTAVIGFASWIGLLSAIQLISDVTLTRLTDTMTMMLTEVFAPRADIGDVALLRINAAEIDQTWRRRHAVVVDKLSQAGAAAIVFDIYFPDESIHDHEFARSIEAAHQRDTLVIVGADEFVDGTPQISRTLATAVEDHVGMLCVGARLGRIAVAPIAVRKQDGTLIKSIALASLMALHSMTSFYIDEHEGLIELASADNRRRLDLQMSAVTERSRPAPTAANSCKVIGAGDLIADRFIELTPLDRLHQEWHNYEYVLETTNQQYLRSNFEGKIVVIGVASEADRFALLSRLLETRYGMEIHADVIRNLDDLNAIRSLAPWAQLMVMCGLGLAAAVIVFAIRHRTSRRLLVIGVALIYALLAIVLLIEFRLLMNTVYQLIAYASTYLIATRIERRWRV